jgi:hypothetical protein
MRWIPTPTFQASVGGSYRFTVRGANGSKEARTHGYGGGCTWMKGGYTQMEGGTHSKGREACTASSGPCTAA